MRKSLSLVLCLAILISAFSMVGITAGAAKASDVMYVKNTPVTDNIITYTVYLKKNVSLTGAVVKMQYDPNVLQVVSGGAYTKTDAYGDEVQNVPGLYVFDTVAGSKNVCSWGYTSTDAYKTGSSDKAFLQVTLKAINKNRPSTNVKFYCAEFIGADEAVVGPHDKAQLVFEHTTKTLSKVNVSSIYSVEKGLRINWTPVEGATAYYIYRQTADGYIRLCGKSGLASTVNYFDDTTVQPHVVYKYLVRAYNNGGFDSGEIEFKASGVYVKAPDRVAVSIQPKSVKLGWTKVTGATTYYLYRREIYSNGTRSGWTSLGTASATATTFFDETVASGKHYEYTVRAGYGKTASAVCRYATIYYYEAPTVNAVSAVGGVNVTWNSIPGAETYRIYRKYNGEKSWTYITTVNKDTFKYLDKAANTGRNIDYTVRAFSSNGSSTFVAKRCAYVATPILKSVSNAVNGVAVKWNAVSGATGYRVYRRGAGSTSWTYLGTVKTTSYTDTKATSGAYWRYTVITEFYQVKSGFDTNGLYLKYVATPKLTGISNQTAGVNIKWNAVGGATGYRVYRRGAGQTTWTYLGTVQTLTFTDKNVVKNSYYRYTVRAVSGNVYSAFDTNGLVIKR